MKSLKIKAGEHLSHAYIVASPSDTERNGTARALAAAMLCLSGGERPCGVCRHCRKALSGVHPDIITVERGFDDKGNRKRFIQVDQIRDVVADAQVMPNEADRKVYLISEADKMNVQAQNAILKVLEEPPESAAFVLCVSNPSFLLPTVRSRCAAFRSNDEDEDDITAVRAAEAYLRLAAAGDRGELLRWCFKNEGMDAGAAAAFIKAASDLLADILCGRNRDIALQPARCVALAGLFFRCTEYLKQYTGVKHVFGLLCADGITK